MSQAKPVNDTNFEAEVLQAPGPVLVDFWAEWCGPCRMVGPVLDELAAEMGNKVTIVKMNVDESPQTPSKYGIRSIPTLLLFKGGQQVSTKIGAVPKQALQAWLQENI
ncbi:MAG: thioredoxin [Alphaproteobacteria bacterium]|nr:thioredoxin [Alphaproteobacteria bacterium]